MATTEAAGSALRLPWLAARGVILTLREALAAAGVCLYRAIAAGRMRGVAALARMYARQRQSYELQKLDDRMLKDIGLSRTEVQSDRRRPVWMQ